MNRLLVFALVASIGNVSVAFAGESILTSGARHVQQLAAAEATTSSTTSVAAPLPTAAVVPVGKTAPSFQQTGSTLSKSGMRKSTKMLLYTGLAVAFIGSVWAIDHHVLDITPSSLGTRQD